MPVSASSQTGDWRAPALDHSNPSGDHRRTRRIHWFADDAIRSLCDKSHRPDSYLVYDPISQTLLDGPSDTPDPRTCCAVCDRLVEMRQHAHASQDALQPRTLTWDHFPTIVRAHELLALLDDAVSTDFVVTGFSQTQDVIPVVHLAPGAAAPHRVARLIEIVSRNRTELRTIRSTWPRRLIYRKPIPCTQLKERPPCLNP